MLIKIVKCLLGFCILCIIQFVCNYIVKYTHLFIPAPILGIIVLSVMLHFNIIKKEWIKDICDLLLKYMPLLFVPLFVGIIGYYGMIQKNLIPILLNVIMTATLTLLITAFFVENIIKFVRLRKMRKFNND